MFSGIHVEGWRRTILCREKEIFARSSQQTHHAIYYLRIRRGVYGIVNAHIKYCVCDIVPRAEHLVISLIQRHSVFGEEKCKEY